MSLTFNILLVMGCLLSIAATFTFKVKPAKTTSNEANLVSAGQVVVQGQQIAESGSTENSTGEHLDFRIYYGGSFFNPSEYLP